MAGVSISTVSLAFSNPTRVSADTLAKVQRASDSVGYAADPLAQSLARGRSRLIGLVVSDISNPFFGGTLRELERSAVAQGHFVIVCDSAGKLEQERALIEHLIGLRVAGIVLTPCAQGEAYARSLRELKVPLVCFDHKVPEIGADFVGSDNRLAAAMLAEHLLQLGHRRIAFIGGTEGLYTSVERLAGFCDTMAGAGVEVDRSLVVDGGYDGDVAYAQAMRLLTRPDRPTAILSANNVMALAALQAIQELGFSCPEQISLAMIDDVPWSKVITPQLTMVVQDINELGRTAANRLLARISDPAVAAEPGRDFILPTRFVPGTSSRRIQP